MATTKLHVTPHDDGWAVKREGNERASSTHSTQKEAIDAARELAKEGDEIVIHRPDGTIRDQVTYTGSSSADGGQGTAPQPGDVMSVGSRVSWGAVFAGVVVALAVYVTLNLFAFAVGLSAFDQMRSNTFAATAAVVSMLCLVVALFIGGFVTSSTTVGEEKIEAMKYGVLVWATTLLLLVLVGFGLGIGFFAGVQDIGTPKGPNTVAEAVQPSALATVVSPQALAWWTFGGVVLSVLAAVGGALTGSGPALIFKRMSDKRAARLTVPRPTAK